MSRSNTAEEKESSTRGIKIASRMPARFHSVPGEAFDLHRSEVIQWLLKQPEIMQWCFDIARGRGLIEYDPATGLWKGRDAV